MIYLPIPLTDTDERTIYSECADALSNKTALGYLEEAVKSANVYEIYVPRDIGNFPEVEIKAGDEKEILKVYKDKFAKRGSIGKKYYEAIMRNARGRCPICGGAKLKNLDHFLPQSIYPLLCVTPANLIPTCRDCNMDKRDYYSTNYYSLPLNPYFDRCDDIWLACCVTYKADKSYEVKFFNGYERTLDENLWNKYETHLRVFDLDATFSSKACEEMEDCKCLYKRLLEKCGGDEVKKSLIEQRKSCEDIDRNSWRAALYRELESRVNEYCEWLKC
ncbi:MAG: hypothetical protein J6H31_15955 [Butyrivibrio sp.]|nr:hypothetical protein [Butyrivibrio sp.]